MAALDAQFILRVREVSWEAHGLGATCATLRINSKQSNQVPAQDRFLVSVAEEGRAKDERSRIPGT